MDSNKQNSNNKKRKRSSPSHANHKDKTKKNRKKLSREELLKEEADSKYDKLVYNSAKSIRKIVKICKTFECQKIVRKIKAMHVSLDDGLDATENDIADNKGVKNEEKKDKKKKKKKEEVVSSSSKTQKDERRIKKLEEKLRYTRAFDLDEIVKVYLSRIGLDSSKVAKKKTTGKGNEIKTNALKDNQSIAGNKDETNQCNKDDNKREEIDNQEYQKALIESILQQKKVVAAMESVNTSVLEYNGWLTKREEQISGHPSKKKRKHDSNKSIINVDGHYGNSGLFIDSLAGEQNQYIDEKQDNEETDSQIEDVTEYISVKRNRMGQRARKARALANEAKRNGRSYDHSKIKKWWELKPKNASKNKSTNELASGLDGSKKVEAAEIVKMGSTWKEEGKAHPSWAARQAQKAKSGSGIANIEFQGKKITFD